MKSSCQDFSYLLDLELFAGLEPVVFDVGCNKGYDTALMFEAFAAQEEFSRIALGKFYESNKQLNDSMSAMNGGTCGVCNDCKESFDSNMKARQRAAANRRLQVHCFEPSETNYQGLAQMHKRFFGSSNKTARGNELRLHKAAMSNYTGTVQMPSNCGELCQIQAKSDSATATTTTVPLTTVDAMLDSLQLQRLFLLKIDTEGFDPLVLQGARRSLAEHKVDLVLFEYNSGGVWGLNGLTLKGVTAELESFGYICYFEGSLLTRITGCWSDELEVKSWSNVICVAGSRPVQAVLRAYSIAPFKGRY
ncbi:hypothetical protein OEZ85_013528 [Tetradesmus obliquus]|uniref:Methyltransferase FkbM domain-containing protein n=1 Tax=Tetradesmus obliquus TaxID=3088 RepID=A0ABY8UQL3_TETOB|nr:hypothetical protein OEZ85_013528 [Tetradesmus obliquus]